MQSTVILTLVATAVAAWEEDAGPAPALIAAFARVPPEVRFVRTSLTPPQADPARLLLLARGHWSSASRHFVRAVTFGQDRSPLRSGDAPQLLAAVRNRAHTLIRRTGTTAIAAARRAFSYHPARALALLLSPP